VGPSLELEREVRGAHLIVRAAGELDLHTADEFRRRLDAWLTETRARCLIVNLRRVTFIDSTGLGAILGRWRRLRAERGTMALVQPAAPARTMLDLAGLGRVLAIFPSEQRALEVLGADGEGGLDEREAGPGFWAGGAAGRGSGVAAGAVPRGAPGEPGAGEAAENEMELTVPARPENVGLCRVAVAAFAGLLPFTLAELEEIRVAVSEAVGNAVLHAYDRPGGRVRVRAASRDGALTVEVSDWGRGIPDVERAMQPEYTTSADPEHLGLGFTFMAQFMDTLEVDSSPGRGTTVRMTKRPRPGAPAGVP
jgi:stage II sporulation protein AB (anti-sigma F factor)